jgi:conjugation system TraG family ATPase
MKKTTLEKVFPIYKVESDCILSKNGDITIAYELKLPEIFSLAANEYEALHHVWVRAIRSLPIHTIIHKQDWFTKCKYQADFTKDPSSFLARSSEKFFHERPYLDHRCYLFITKKGNPKRTASVANSSLFKKNLVAASAIDTTAHEQFIDKVGQFVRILEDSSFIQIHRLSSAEIAGTDAPGILEKYCYLLHPQEPAVVRDIQLNPTLQIGELHTDLFTLADVADLPALCGQRINYDKYSTDQTKLSVGFPASLCLLLYCNHIYNQFITVDDTQATIKKLEAKKLRLQSLSTYSRDNAISRDATNQFLNEAIAQQRLPVKAHYNVLLWSDDPSECKEARNKVAAALAQIDARVKQESASAAQLFWCGIPGNAAELPYEEVFDTFAEQACCFLNNETNYQSSPSPIGIRLGDRLTGLPIHLDLSEWPLANGMIQNLNRFVLASSGSGKSFFCNHLVRSYFEQGAHVLLIDVGHSYKGLCELVGGYYFAYDEKDPIQFNPFFLAEDTMDTEKKESIKTLLLSLWKREDETFSRAEYVSLSNAIQSYYDMLDEHPEVFPCFNSFFEFIRDVFHPTIRQIGVKEKDFDIDNMLYVLRPYFSGGEFDYLLNAKTNLDLLHQPFIVFELDAIREHAILFPTVTLTIMATFINKMRKLKGVRKVILIEEAWKSIMKQGMAEYIKYLFKTVRKHYGEAIVVSQDVDDIISSPVIKDAIINNSDCKILLDQSKYLNKFDRIQEVLGLTDKEKAMVLSLNKANDPTKKYKEVFISLGNTYSRVFRVEVSLEEYLTYTTQEKEKVQVQAFAKKYGSMRKGVAMLAQQIRNKIAS